MDELDDLFDLAPKDMSGVGLEAQQFLLRQRLKGRPCTISFSRRKRKAVLEISEESSVEMETGTSVTRTAESDSYVSALMSSASIASTSQDDPEFDISEYENTQAEIPPIMLNKHFINER